MSSFVWKHFSKVDEIHDDDDDDDDLEDEVAVALFEPVVDYDVVIKKMREIIKIFRYSPMKTSILQTIQRLDGKKPLKLHTDVKTRWNSLVISVKRFLVMLPSITQALKHKEIKSKLQWNPEDTKVLQVFININYFSEMKVNFVNPR